MIASAAAWLVARGVPLRFARPLMLTGVALLALVLVALAWRCSVDNAVDEREAGQRAVNAEQARKADQGTAEQQRADDARNRAERGELEKVPTDAATPLSDRDRAYLRCVRLQQRARTRGEPVPAC